MKAQYRRLRAVDGDDPFPARVDGRSYFELLDLFVRLSEEKDFKLVFNLPPCHVSLLETFYQAGVWEQFQLFKKKVASSVMAANERYGVSVPVYDFCVYASQNAEVIMDRQDQMAPPTTFWDSGHMSDATGDAAIAIMLGSAAPSGSYGTDLAHTRNIEAHVAEDLARRGELRAALPREFARYDAILSGE